MTAESNTVALSRTPRVALIVVALIGCVSCSDVASREHERADGKSLSRPPQADRPGEAGFPAGSPVVAITLPYEEPDLPPGPHVRDFHVACTTCHSTRLALTQPPFPKAKWEATVKKMVDAFGAPLTREEQAHAVEYLTAVRGK